MQVRTLTRNGSCDDTEWGSFDITDAANTGTDRAVLVGFNIKNVTQYDVSAPPDPLPKIKVTTHPAQDAGTVVTCEANNGTMRLTFAHPESVKVVYLRSLSGSNDFEVIAEYVLP